MHRKSWKTLLAGYTLETGLFSFILLILFIFVYINQWNCCLLPFNTKAGRVKKRVSRLAVA